MDGGRDCIQRKRERESAGKEEGLIKAAFHTLVIKGTSDGGVHMQLTIASCVLSAVQNEADVGTDAGMDERKRESSDGKAEKDRSWSQR